MKIITSLVLIGFLNNSFAGGPVGGFLLRTTNPKLSTSWDLYGNGSFDTYISADGIDFYGVGENDAHHMVLGENNNHTTFKKLTQTSIKKIVTTSTNTCIISSTDTVLCGGQNNRGESGKGVFGGTQNTWRDLGLTNIVELVGSPSSLNYGGFFARKNDGTIYAWGDNCNGRFGIGNTTCPNDTMNSYNVATVAFPSGSNVVKMAMGAISSCFIYSDGSVKCFGGNVNGQLGDGTTTDSLTPVTVLNVSNAVDIVAGLNHFLVRTSTPEVWAWGYNNNGQLGDNTLVQKPTPVNPSVLNNASIIMAGNDGSAAIVGGELYTAGRNSEYQYGDGTNVRRTVFTKNTLITGTITNATMGSMHLCIKIDGIVKCAGHGGLGQLGTGSYKNSPIFKPVVTPF